MKLWIGLVVFLAAGMAQAGQSTDGNERQVESIKIRSSWGGLSPDSPLITELELKRSGNDFVMTGSNSRAHKLTAMAPVHVPAVDVVELGEALRMPPVPEFSLPEFGVPISAIQQQVDSEIEDDGEAGQYPELVAKLHAYREALRDPATLSATLTKGFSGFHTDDYPGVRIEATFSDGTTLVATSRSQQYLMLPWKRDGLGATYSPAISRALLRLLPEGATNRERLVGPIDDGTLREMVSAALYEKLSWIWAESKAGAALRVLEDAFEVSDVRAQDPTPAIKLGKVLFAELHLRGGPPNLHMAVRLPLKGDALEDPEGDVTRIRNALSLAQSAPGLAAQMAENADEEFRMSDRFGYSWLTEEAAGQFVEQMQHLQKLPELKADPRLMRDAVMVEVGWSPTYWIVLPDRRAILWKKYWDSSTSPGTFHCDGIPTGDDFMDRMNQKKDLCIGKVYSAEGKELP